MKRGSVRERAGILRSKMKEAATIPSPAIEDMRTFLSAMAALTEPPSDEVVVMRSFLGQLARLHAEQPAPDASTQNLPEDSLPDMARFLSALAPHAETRWAPPGYLDLWHVASIRRNEVRNTAVLGWILDPQGTHGRRADVLDGLARDLRKKWETGRGRTADPGCFPLADTLIDCRVRTEVSPFADASKRVDIVIDGRDFTLFVETKVDAPEGEGQVASYLELAERRAMATGKTRWGVLFIAPRIARTLSSEDPRVIVARWADVAEAIMAALRQHPGDPVSHALLRSFANHIRSF